ncbi:BREX-4 system phosphatase PglZ [Butyrivibrio sp. AE3003]|uniref:BREX-4 system phosphatase PglZ n=1 Tax=Butyrivibrio sp. AE3003 TaxID=1496721 RepID=UPI00047A62C5|nr:BREX-4 system phosphatase PglZ [Butyrivibrio sp. AE3003]
MELGGIKEKIAEDKAKTTSSYRRYPVRFLFMELNNNTQDEIMDLVKSGNGELLELSDYVMQKDDGWLTKSRFMQVINTNVSKNKDTYVVGFSEMIRFYSRKEIESTVVSLFDIENSDIMDSEEDAARRIYFICFSMMDDVYRVLQNCFSRINLINPFINSDYELSGKYRQICFVSDDYADNIKYNKISKSVDWIGLWKNSQILDFSRPIWCCSASLFEWHKKASPDNAFQIDVVENTKQYLQKILDFEIGFDYKESEAIYWNRLLEDIDNIAISKSLGEAISFALGVDVTKIEALAGKLFISDSNYEKWLIRNYVLVYAEESFLSRVIKYSIQGSVKDFLLNVWLQGYKISNLSMLEERLRIITEINKYANSYIPEESIQEEIVNDLSRVISVPISNGANKYGVNFIEIGKSNGLAEEEMKIRVGEYFSRIFKPAYTGLSYAEKEFLINLHAYGFLDRGDMQIMYPSYYSYLYGVGDNLVKGLEGYKLYLKEYKKSKATNKDTSYIRDYYNNGCANASNLFEMYYAIEKQDVLVEKLTDERTDIYVIDGVGAEYLSLIVDLLNRNSYDVEICGIATAHLPTITEVNKTYLSRLPIKKWYLDFDRDVVHGDLYHTTCNLRKAFDVIEKIIKEIVSESYGKRIIITADHGATARARWVETPKKYGYSQSDHEGRCCKISSKNGYENNEDYIAYVDEVNPEISYLISLNETSLYNRPKYEDHGGATIEEMLVPVIVANLQGSRNKIKYKVMDEKIQVSGLDKIVRFVINPEPESAFLIEADGTRHELCKDGKLYTTELVTGRVQEIFVQVGDMEFKFITENNARKNMEGDDGFDD